MKYLNYVKSFEVVFFNSSLNIDVCSRVLGVGSRSLGRKWSYQALCSHFLRRPGLSSLWLLVVWTLNIISFCDQFLCSGLFEGSGPSVMMCHIPLMSKVTLEDCDEVWDKRLVFRVSVF